MSDPYIGEIRIFANNYAPYGWYVCNGAFLAIQQYTPLYATIGTTYGGNGVSTFALPNFNAALLNFAPVGTGAGAREGISYDMNEMAGESAVTLYGANLPAHTHSIEGALASAAHTVNAPADNKISRYLPSPPNKVYSSAALNVEMSAKSLSVYGKSQPHENRQPSLALNFYIAWDGVFATPD